MPLSIRGWRPAHLLLSWSAYWAGLAAVTLWPASGAIRRVAEPGARGTVSAGFADGLLKLTIGAEGGTPWEGVASLGTVALWVTVPPLVLWVLWLMTRRPAAEKGTPTVVAPPTHRALDAGRPEELPRRAAARRDPIPVERDALLAASEARRRISALGYLPVRVAARQKCRGCAAQVRQG